MFFPGLYSKQNYFQGDQIGYLFYPFLISAFFWEKTNLSVCGVLKYSANTRQLLVLARELL